MPSEIGDYIGGANALRDTGRFDEADVVLAEALARFPDNLGIAIDRAWVAHRRGDCDEAVARWAAVREALPDHHAGYTGAALTLREAGRFDDAEAILTEGMTQLPEAPEPAVDHAWLAQVRRDWPQAIARWAAVRERFGYLPVGYTAGAVALRESGQIEDAAALLVAAEAKFAEIPAPAIELAWLAIHRHDWDDAIKRWDDVRRRFPDQQAGYIGGSVALREAGRLGDAEGLLSAAQDCFPGEAGIVIEQAHLATRRRDWDAASQRWTLVRDRFPDNIAGYTGGALALREQRKFAEADTLLKQAASRFPETPEPLTELAWVAHVAHDWPEAARRWDDVRARFGGLPAGYTGGAHALREMGRYDEAESLFQQALARFPNERNILIDYAWLATARRDWPEAVQRWAIVRAGFPNAREAYLRGAQALATMWQYDEADALLAEGIARFPDDSELACEAGWLALNRKLPDEAERRFELVRTRFPDDPVGHLGAALVLRDKFELAATEALLEEACRRLPEARRLALEHAQLPMFAPLKRDRDPDEALRRLERVRERFPDYDEAYLAAIRYLRQEGRLDEADTVCAGACERLTQSPTVFTEYGAIAAERA
ncbi:MAG TPA: tetratricopeptide repeat protein, partial [Stellaceae bacterium]|nr:tetratricopeptide repeat protein [Stellaceae bacterium]